MKVFDHNEFMSDISSALLVPKVAIGFVVALGLVIAALFVIFPILLAVKVDSAKSWSWFAVFSPGNDYIYHSCIGGKCGRRVSNSMR